MTPSALSSLYFSVMNCRRRFRKHDVPDVTWYPETEFCHMKNKSGMFVAAKGGFNNESHNHNDAGTFSLYVNTIPVLIDAGVGTYIERLSVENDTPFGPCKATIIICL